MNYSYKLRSIILRSQIELLKFKLIDRKDWSDSYWYFQHCFLSWTLAYQQAQVSRNCLVVLGTSYLDIFKNAEIFQRFLSPTKPEPTHIHFIMISNPEPEINSHFSIWQEVLTETEWLNQHWTLVFWSFLHRMKTVWI